MTAFPAKLFEVSATVAGSSSDLMKFGISSILTLLPGLFFESGRP